MIPTLVLALTSVPALGAMSESPGAPGTSIAPAPVQEHGVAPDGHRGLGSETELKDLLKIMRTTKDAERAFLASLRAIETDVRLLAAGAAERYRRQGYFELLDSRSERNLEQLHAAFLAAEEDPSSALSASPAAAEAFARMFLDTRFRARLFVLATKNSVIAYPTKLRNRTGRFSKWVRIIRWVSIAQQ